MVGAPISTSVPSTAEVAIAAEAIIWFIASATAESSSSDSSEGASDSGASSPIMTVARRRAPSSVITNTLPPVTPSTYATLDATAGVGTCSNGSETTVTSPGATWPGASISRTPVIASSVERPSRISASSLTTVPPAR